MAEGSRDVICLGDSDDEERRAASAPAIELLDSDDEEPVAAEKPVAHSADVIELLDEPAAARPLFSCPICLDDEAEELLSFACSHSLCRPCAESYLRSKIEEGVVGERLKCFSVNPACSARLKQADVRRALGRAVGGVKLMDAYLGRRLEATDGGEQRVPPSSSLLTPFLPVVPCPGPGCTFRFIRTPGVPSFTCPHCTKSFCLDCGDGAAWHPGLTCEKARARAARSGMAQYVSDNRGDLRSCPKCKALVSRVSGCNAIMCRCGQSFCWGCGKGAAGDAHGCTCGRGGGR